MGAKRTNGITDHSPVMKYGGETHVRKRLVELTRRYNPEFSQTKLDSLIEKGTFDYFGEATGKSPSTSLEVMDSSLMNDLYQGLRDNESKKGLGGGIDGDKKEAGGQLDSVSDMLPSANPMSVIQQTDMSVIQPMSQGGAVTMQVNQPFYVVDNDFWGYLSFANEQEVNITNEEGGGLSWSNAFLKYSDAIEALLRYLRTKEGVEFAERFPKSKFTVTQKIWKGGFDRYAEPNVKDKKILSLTSRDFLRMSAQDGFEDGGSVDLGSEVLFPYGISQREMRGYVTREVDDEHWEVSHNKGMSLVSKEAIIGLAPRRKRRFGIFDGGGEASDKFQTVMSEYKAGSLKHGTTHKKVKDLDMAIAIAYSEAQKIDPSFGKYEGGGDTNKVVAMDKKNEEIASLLAHKGLKKENYSAMDLQTITHYSYPNRMDKFLVNKMWGLAMKHKMGGFEGKNILVLNSGNGEMLRFIPDSVNSVEAYEQDSNLYMITSVLFGSEKVKVHKRLRTLKHEHDFVIGVCSGVKTIVDKDVIDYTKSGALMIAVVNSGLMNGAFPSEEKIINDNFTLLEAYRLPSDVMDGFDLIALKRK